MAEKLIPALYFKENLKKAGVAEINFRGLDEPLFEVDLKRAKNPNHEGLFKDVDVPLDRVVR